MFPVTTNIGEMVNKNKEGNVFAQSAGELTERFGIEHLLQFEEVPGGMMRAIINTPQRRLRSTFRVRM